MDKDLHSGIRSVIYDYMKSAIQYPQFYDCSDNVFSPLDAGYLEKCVINLKSPLAAVEIPNKVVSHIYY